MRQHRRVNLGAIAATIVALSMAFTWSPHDDATAQQVGPAATSSPAPKGEGEVAGTADPDPRPNPGDSLPLKFVAIVALATAIERFWESIFGFVESFGLAGSRLLKGTAEVMAWAKAEQDRAVAALKALTDKLSKTAGAATPGELLAFQEAEKQLLDARSRIEEALKSPQYLAFKRAVTTLGSLLLGVGINLLCQLELLKAAGFGGAGWADWVFTGFAIGAGPGPLHALIKTLEELRGALGGVADLARGTAVKKAVDALRGSAVASVEQTRAQAGPGAGALEAVVVTTAAVQIDELRLQRQAQRLLRPRG